MKNTLLVSVIICTFSLKRFKITKKTIESIINQSYENYEIIIVVDGNKKLFRELEAEYEHSPKIVLLENEMNEGPSVSRNYGISCSKGEVVAFIDDDAFASSDWLETIVKNFLVYDNIVACGGKLIPVYETGAQKLPEELLWIVGCTYRGHTERKQFVRNVISANMAVKKEVFNEVQFEKMFDGKNWKMEDTLFGIRIFMRNKNAILYDPRMIVYHNVPTDRTKLRYICQRAFSEGVLKADLGIVINKTIIENDIFHQEHRYLVILIRSIMIELFNVRTRSFISLSLAVLSTTTGLIYESIVKRHKNIIEKM